MRIVSKINLALGAVVGVSALLNLAALELTVMPSFLDLEGEVASRNQSRVLQALQSQEAQVSASARDYAFWDDSYAFMAGEKADYLAKNVNADSIKALSLNYFLTLDTTGKVILDDGYDFSEEETEGVKLLPSETLPARHPLRVPFREPGSRSGFIRTDRGIVAVGYAPILTSERTGPAAGTLLFGRILDTAALRDQTKVDFELLPAGTDAATTEEIIRNGDVIEVRSTVTGLDGAPLLTVVSKTGRSISAAGRQAVWAAMALLILGGFLLIATLGLALRHIAIGRVEAIRDHLRQVGMTGHLEPIAEDKRDDELSETISSFNAMAIQLADLRDRLRERDYRHGAADQAAGILHNVRNAISPIGAISWDLARREEAPWKRNLETALEQVADPALPPERIAKLQQFVAMSTAKLLDEAKERRADLETLASMVRHVDEILKEADGMSQGERVAEPIDLASSVGKAARLIGGKAGIVVTADVEAGAVLLGHRIALEQVLGNLLVNAAEAIEATGRGHGRIEITAAEIDVGGVACLDVTLRDDGEGIDPDRLETIFEKGFSTRRDRSGGTGLHWSANAVNAMNGRLFATSPGVGCGAALHLVLPRAQARLKDAA
ncbi:signal transduction histidine kinase [Aureimonas sp. SA4125]|uniref:sensor histidine kinase n=1 Tax=Aureimonas sp. SA4125 TaxID=2826993 RepID=UPI001CC46E93|nr:CHASE4 domain-containing protein [Aureimonas sp. SA4125]BDA83014.1 signal transduction histidine kinase [Aureimonas sp. SA4125]